MRKPSTEHCFLLIRSLAIKADEPFALKADELLAYEAGERRASTCDEVDHC